MEPGGAYGGGFDVAFLEAQSFAIFSSNAKYLGIVFHSKWHNQPRNSKYIQLANDALASQKIIYGS